MGSESVTLLIQIYCRHASLMTGDGIPYRVEEKVVDSTEIENANSGEESVSSTTTLAELLGYVAYQ